MDRVRAALGIPEDISVSGKGVRVAVIDTGVDATHPDLDGGIDLDASKNYGLTRAVSMITRGTVLISRESSREMGSSAMAVCEGSLLPRL